MAMAFVQDNLPCHTANIVQERFEEHSNEFEMVTRVEKTSPIHKGFTSQHKGSGTESLLLSSETSWRTCMLKILGSPS